MGHATCISWIIQKLFPQSSLSSQFFISSVIYFISHTFSDLLPCHSFSWGYSLLCCYMLHGGLWPKSYGISYWQHRYQNWECLYENQIHHYFSGVYIKIDNRFMELRPLLTSINKKLTEQYFIDCSFEGSKWRDQAYCSNRISKITTIHIRCPSQKKFHETCIKQLVKLGSCCNKGMHTSFLMMIKLSKNFNTWK